MAKVSVGWMLIFSLRRYSHGVQFGLSTSISGKQQPS
jgi:hypothetical protein